ncbi:MAG: class I SAM-dependent methyltransferase [Thermoleophilia bacterium]|nr:class I SAM-dependent methyltransferase [Thermoleophilia bacterium]
MGDLTQRSTLSPEQIREYWSAQATQHGQKPAASWSDWRAIELEIEAISQWIGRADEVLDAGCATGYSTARYAALTDRPMLGVDYAPEMIEQALERRNGLPAEIGGRLDFRVEDVRELGARDGSFDRVVCTRVVINLAERAEQARALTELARVLRPGGLLLLSEATLQGLERLNALRAEWGLPAIGIPEFNLYLDEETLADEAGPSLALERVENFASTYFVATRLLKPLLANAAPTEVDVADPDAELNRWAAQLPAAGDYGTQKLFVFRRV